MRQQTRKGYVARIVALLVVLAAVPALACSVPVFRYALEQWKSDSYQVVIFHRGALSEETEAVVSRLEEASSKSTNVRTVTVDLDDEPDEQQLKLWKSQETETLPWMVVRYPIPIPEVWAGPPTLSVAESLIDSPLRQEIAGRLLRNGDSAVWVLVEGSNPEENDAAFKVLEERIAHEEDTLELDEIDKEDIDNGLLGLAPDELKIAFSALRVSRDNADEKLFVDMLLGSESDLRGYDKPIVFPVFGRGRVLYGLVGGGINDSTIHQAGRDLTGPCTCQVKDENPGIDLVMSVPWDQVVNKTIDVEEALPVLPSAGGPLTPVDNEVTFNNTDTASGETAIHEPAASPEEEVEDSNTVTTMTPTKTNPPTVRGSGNVMRNTLFLLGGLLTGVIGLSIFLVARK